MAHRVLVQNRVWGAAMSQRFIILLLLLPLLTVANIRAVSPADDPTSPEHAISSFLFALRQDDTTAAKELYESSYWQTGRYAPLRRQNEAIVNDPAGNGWQGLIHSGGYNSVAVETEEFGVDPRSDRPFTVINWSVNFLLPNGDFSPDIRYYFIVGWYDNAWKVTIFYEKS